MKIAAVIGNPVSHSLSPVLHRYWCAKYNVDADYHAIQLKPDDLDSFLGDLRSGKYVGANVTIPFKGAIFDKMDTVDTPAMATDAVNTIVSMKEGGLQGRNTDPEGFMRNLLSKAPLFIPEKTTALILGAGGAARAATYALLGAGAREIIITSRSAKNDDALVRFFSSTRLRTAPWPDRNSVANKATLVVNATPLGMKGFGELDINLSGVNKEALVYDLVYSPQETGFLKKAKAAGLLTIDGLGMLVCQAAPAFEAWFGVRPEVNDETCAMLASHVNSKGS